MTEETAVILIRIEGVFSGVPHSISKLADKRQWHALVMRQKSNNREYPAPDPVKEMTGEIVMVVSMDTRDVARG